MMKIKDLRAFLDDPTLDENAQIQIGFERYDGNDDGTDIGYDYVTNAELFAFTKHTIKKKVLYRLTIWATNYPGLDGEIIKTTKERT